MFCRFYRIINMETTDKTITNSQEDSLTGTSQELHSVFASTWQEPDDCVQIEWEVIIHVTAVISLTVSTSVSLFTLIYALRQSGNSTVFWKKKIADRFVIYLALCDFLWR